jgi:hypothetical protein
MTIQEKLEAVFAKVRALPEARALLGPALAEAKRGENLIDDEDLDFHKKP